MRSNAVAASVLERHPRIDLLVNNAGIARAFELPRRRPGAHRAGAARQLPRLGLDDARVPARPRRGLPRRQRRLGRRNGGGRARTPRRSMRSSLSPARSPSSSRRAKVAVHTVNPGFVETPGFPQRGRFGRLASRLVVEPQLVVRRIARGRRARSPRDRRPALVPGRVDRAGARARARRPSTVASGRTSRAGS